MRIKTVFFVPLLLSMTPACSRKIDRSYLIEIGLQTPQGLRTGQGVIRVQVSSTLDRRQGHRYPKVTGEAIPIKMSNEQYAFMLVDKPTRGWEVSAPWTSDEDMEALEGGEKVPIQKNMLPGFAFFRDIRDPHSVKQLKVDGVLGDSSKIKVAYAFIRRSEDRLSHGASDILPWLKKDNIRYESINRITPEELANSSNGLADGKDPFYYLVSYRSIKREK